MDDTASLTLSHSCGLDRWHAQFSSALSTGYATGCRRPIPTIPSGCQQCPESSRAVNECHETMWECQDTGHEVAFARIRALSQVLCISSFLLDKTEIYPASRHEHGRHRQHKAYRSCLLASTWTLTIRSVRIRLTAINRHRARVHELSRNRNVSIPAFDSFRFRFPASNMVIEALCYRTTPTCRLYGLHLFLRSKQVIHTKLTDNTPGKTLTRLRMIPSSLGALPTHSTQLRGFQASTRSEQLRTHSAAAPSAHSVCSSRLGASQHLDSGG